MKRIEAHSDEELNAAVNAANNHCALVGLHFYRILHGIDAYMERRKRRDRKRHQKIIDECAAQGDFEDAWGNS